MIRRCLVFNHRWAGLAMTAFLVLVGITGSLLAFYSELDHLVAPYLFATPRPGMAPDHAKARELLEKAAEKGETLAQANLGMMYAVGQGVPQDIAKARELLEKAKAHEVFEEGADQGNAMAMLNLGYLYQYGYGVAQDYAKAREWSEKAVGKGVAMAMVNLGVLYMNGQGAPQDYAKARELFEKAAEKGVAGAMYNLGGLYNNGWGVAQDYAKAREWYEKAADKGAPQAMSNLEALQLREAAAAKQELAETKRKGKPGKETAEALINVTWYALFARDFPKALSVGERAHALLPDNHSIEINRAHALMFLGRTRECTALYLAYKGKPMSASDNRLSERVIADDFAEFRKAGLKHPMMAEIEKKLDLAR